MNPRLFDHLDLHVCNLVESEAFYSVILPALGFPARGTTSQCIYFEAKRETPKPEFIALIEDPAYIPSSTRIAFWCDTKVGVDRFATLLAASGAKNIEGPGFCPEYTPTYYAVYFEDPCGNKFELCCRIAEPAEA